jgi:hypothetical protein
MAVRSVFTVPWVEGLPVAALRGSVHASRMRVARIPARFNSITVNMSSSFFMIVIIHVGEMIVDHNSKCDYESYLF